MEILQSIGSFIFYAVAFVVLGLAGGAVIVFAPILFGALIKAVEFILEVFGISEKKNLVSSNMEPAIRAGDRFKQKQEIESLKSDKNILAWKLNEKIAEVQALQTQTAEVENCSIEGCPRLWTRFEDGGSPLIRHCNHCKLTVFFSNDRLEADAFDRDGIRVVYEERNAIH